MRRDPEERELDASVLAVAAQRGDQGAFRQLFELHQAGVYSLIAYLVGSPEDAADLTQTVFIKAWRALPELREPEHFAAWLYRIARHAAYDHRRRAGRRPATAPIEAAEGEQAASAEQEVVSGERRVAVRRAISELPEKHREVVVLHHLNGVDVKTIGEALGIPTNTVVSRLSRARLTLRRKLTSVVEED